MEITLFNKLGTPEAYIKEKDQTIFLWDGNVAAYIEGDHIYSWDGNHIGWYEDDILFNLEGCKIASTKWACPSVTAVEPRKAKKIEKGTRGDALKSEHSKKLKNYYSEENLRTYFQKY